MELDTLKRKFKDKEMTEKVLKNKLKEVTNESKLLLDNINSKEKDLSSKMT